MGEKHSGRKANPLSRILVLAEGQTEETFVRDVLGPYFALKGIFLIAKLATTKRVKKGPDFKGGIVSYGKVRYDLMNLLKDTDVVCVTTMIDYYGLPSDFPGYHSTSKRGIERVKFLEQKFKEDIGDGRFIPNFEVHEFEAMLFVDPGETAGALLDTGKEKKLAEIKGKFETPEDINDNPQTAPSKRLSDIFPGYQKKIYGPLVTQRIGLARIRGECLHFNEWLTKLEIFESKIIGK